MSQRFIRCPHCGAPHDAACRTCPSTGRLFSGRSPSRPPSPAPVAKGLADSKPAPDQGLVGTTIGGKYVVGKALGSGGMGTVFAATHVGIGGAVALKILLPNHAQNSALVQRFRREALAASRVQHPNVCAVYDFGTVDDGRPYLVMERLVGATLAQSIRARGALPFGDAIDILVQTLSALDTAHRKGIIHRDVKPENLLLATRVGCPPLVKLLDFGVSKRIAPATDDGVDLTRSGMVMGTPHYMSPEQARGDKDIDERVDLYACGVVLYEAMTGHRPFVAADWRALLRHVLLSSPPPVHDLRPSLPGAFDAVMRKAMARNREHRYETAIEFQRALSDLVCRGPSSTSTAVGGGSPAARRFGPFPGLKSTAPQPHAHAAHPPHMDAHPTRVFPRGPPPLPTDDAAPTRVMPRMWQIAAGAGTDPSALVGRPPSGPAQRRRPSE